jgi:hypothetical protein
MTEHTKPEHGHAPSQRQRDVLKAAALDGRRADIENIFTYHAPKDDQQERYEKLREHAKALALQIIELTPYSREQSLALTHLETANMFANASIARNE